MSSKSKRKVVLKISSRKPDIFLINLAIILTIFGLVMVGNTSVVEAYREFGDKFYYLKLQLQWVGLGLLGMLGGLKIELKRLRKFTFPLLTFSFLCLVAVLIPGVGIKVLGAKRWLGIGQLRFQPSELTKFIFILWAAAFLSNKKNTGVFLGVLGVLGFLIMLQPDLGTTVVLVIVGLSILFASGESIWRIGLLGAVSLITGVGLIFSSNYRRERFLTFLNPSRDPFGASYHIRQILIALGSGGFFGVGLGQSRQKYQYIPAVTTDSIFAVIAEEMGFIGASLVILIFLLLIWRGFKIAKMASDKFNQLLAVGITTWIGFQALMNLAAMTALVPLTGIPLPFISYGGSSLVLILTGVGVLANISRDGKVRK